MKGEQLTLFIQPISESKWEVNADERDEASLSKYTTICHTLHKLDCSAERLWKMTLPDAALQNGAFIVKH